MIEKMTYLILFKIRSQKPEGICYGYAYQRQPEVAMLISDKIGL